MGWVLSCETGRIPRCRSCSVVEKATSSMRKWLACDGPCAVGDPMHVETSFVRNLGDLTRALAFARAGSGREDRTLNMYADEESDRAIVPRKRPNNGRQLPAEDVEERAGTKGNSRQAAAVRTLSRGAASTRMAVVRRATCGLARTSPDVRPEVGARCVSSARRDLCGGCRETGIPTANGTHFKFASRFPDRYGQPQRRRAAGRPDQNPRSSGYNRLVEACCRSGPRLKAREDPEADECQRHEKQRRWRWHRGRPNIRKPEGVQAGVKEHYVEQNARHRDKRRSSANLIRQRHDV